MADARANTPEKQREVLTLVIDRETSAEVSRINTEIGKSVYHWNTRRHPPHLSEQERLWKDWNASYDAEQRAVALGNDPSYDRLLNEYIGLKLYLHDMRRSMYYRGDPYCEREDVDVKSILERCDELKQAIKEKRRVVRFAAWGGMEPDKKSAYDKPLLYAFDEFTCSFVTEFGSDENDTPDILCPLKGEHWYHGRPYCRAHLGETRRLVKLEKRRKRGRWTCDKPNCGNLAKHYHEYGKTHYY